MPSALGLCAARKFGCQALPSWASDSCAEHRSIYIQPQEAQARREMLNIRGCSCAAQECFLSRVLESVLFFTAASSVARFCGGRDSVGCNDFWFGLNEGFYCFVFFPFFFVEVPPQSVGET